MRIYDQGLAAERMGKPLKARSEEDKVAGGRARRREQDWGDWGQGRGQGLLPDEPHVLGLAGGAGAPAP